MGLSPEKTICFFGWHITCNNSPADGGSELIKSSKDAESLAVSIF